MTKSIKMAKWQIVLSIILLGLVIYQITIMMKIWDKTNYGKGFFYFFEYTDFNISFGLIISLGFIQALIGLYQIYVYRQENSSAVFLASGAISLFSFVPMLWVASIVVTLALSIIGINLKINKRGS